MTTEPVRTRITEKRPFLRLAEKHVSAKNALKPEKTPEISLGLPAQGIGSTDSGN